MPKQPPLPSTIYGSSRLGVIRAKGNIVGITPEQLVYLKTIGLKDYELTDHLQNVQVVLSDAKNLSGKAIVEAGIRIFLLVKLLIQ